MRTLIFIAVAAIAIPAAAKTQDFGINEPSPSDLAPATDAMVEVIGLVDAQTDTLGAMADSLNRIEEKIDDINRKVSTKEDVNRIMSKLDDIQGRLGSSTSTEEKTVVETVTETVVPKVIERVIEQPAPKVIERVIQQPSTTRSVVQTTPYPGIVLNPGEILMSVNSVPVNRTVPYAVPSTTPSKITYDGLFRDFTIEGPGSVNFDPGIGRNFSFNTQPTNQCYTNPLTGQTTCPQYNPSTVTTPPNDTGRGGGSGCGPIRRLLCR